MSDPKLMDLNPYAPPKAPLGSSQLAIGNDRAVVLRRKNLGYETTFRALALINLLGAAVEVAFIAVASAYTLKPGEIQLGVSSWGGSLWLVHLFLVVPAIVLLHLILWLGFRQFRSWAYWTQVFISCVGVLPFILSWVIVWSGGRFGEFMIATAFLSGITQLAILHCLLASNARRVLAPDYREAIALTPSIRNRLGWPLYVGLVPFSIAAEWGFLGLAMNITRLVGSFFE